MKGNQVIMSFGFSFLGIMILVIFVLIVYNIKMESIYRYYAMLKSYFILVNKCEKAMVNKNFLEYHYGHVTDEVRETKNNVKIYFIPEKEFFTPLPGKE